ncbi:bifunctional metallophosphatase/5'-nucleotidase [Fructobacillus sp. M2-14]|uniref:Bifunctional metallophosphatase/5'-nucleotidase n=1 Tax=Fructobacillus broussonetiae TaxID=2713173 RepID=A0ABS5QYL1_9LACO|nr:bifunctional UDP-sugar hydrolase/5'-nucleotidase [Fructobacillus broussonetiae]MBS9338283.1 bifunctional metallophosphatase/5'-nucleotidase [Fructobacillus broussonetiae]
METLDIRHTNDMHSHFGPWPKIKRFLLKGTDQNGTIFRFDIGDAIDRFHPLTDITLGKANIDILNDAHYNAVTIGNNEGLVMPHEELNHLYDRANFDVLLANMKDGAKRTQPSWAKPYKIYKSENGTKVAVIGMTAPYFQTYNTLDWYPEEPTDVLDKYLPEIRKKADVVILLSHLGLPTDRDLAKDYDINLIIGAHTHHLLPDGELNNGTWLAAAGRYGANVGQVKMTLDDNHKVTDVWVKAFNTDDLPAKDGDDEWVADVNQAGIDQEETIMATTYEPAVSKEEQAEDCLDALKDFMDLPVAIASTGLFLNDLPAGPKSKYTFLKDIPHSIHPMRLTLTGKDLKAWVAEWEHKADKLLTEKIKGSGFRGKVFGKMVTAGLGVSEAGDLLYDGQVVKDEKQYDIATLDHYRWLDFFTMVDEAPAKIYLATLLREMQADYYQKRQETQL